MAIRLVRKELLLDDATLTALGDPAFIAVWPYGSGGLHIRAVDEADALEAGERRYKIKRPARARPCIQMGERAQGELGVAPGFYSAVIDAGIVLLMPE